MSDVALPKLTLPLTCSVPATTVLPVAPATVKLAEPTSRSVVTVKSDPIVTSSGNAIFKVTFVPDLEAVVTISLAVPVTCKSSVSKDTSPVPESPSTVNAVAIVTVLAAVNLPCWSTVITGIAVCEPYEAGVTEVSSRSIVKPTPLALVVIPVKPVIANT